MYIYEQLTVHERSSEEGFNEFALAFNLLKINFCIFEDLLLLFFILSLTHHYSLILDEHELLYS